MDQAGRIITLYLAIEEIYNELTAERPLRRGGFPPALSDVDVLTMEITGELEGKNGEVLSTIVSHAVRRRLALRIKYYVQKVSVQFFDDRIAQIGKNLTKIE